MNEHQIETSAEDIKGPSVLKSELRSLIREKNVNSLHPVVRAVARAVEQKKSLEDTLHNLNGKIISKNKRVQEWLKSQGSSLKFTESDIRIEPGRLVPDLDSGQGESFKIYVEKGSLPTTTIQDLNGTSPPPNYAYYRKWRDKEIREMES